jgi:hypothetical protein
MPASACTFRKTDCDVSFQLVSSKSTLSTPPEHPYSAGRHLFNCCNSTYLACANQPNDKSPVTGLLAWSYASRTALIRVSGSSNWIYSEQSWVRICLALEDSSGLQGNHWQRLSPVLFGGLPLAFRSDCGLRPYASPSPLRFTADAQADLLNGICGRNVSSYSVHVCSSRFIHFFDIVGGSRRINPKLGICRNV